MRVLTVTGVGPSSSSARTVYVNDVPEAAHLACALPSLTLAVKEIPRSRLKIGDPQPVPRKSPEYQCLRCGKLHERGGRIVEVYRVEGYAKDPATNAPGMRCTDGIETAHLDCGDPQSNGENDLIILGSA